MAKKAKGNRIQVILECTEHKDSGQPGTSRYITTKNRKNTPERMEIKKFNPILRKYTVHKEIKQKSALLNVNQRQRSLNKKDMAKKVVASLQKGGGKEHSKVIRMVKSEKTGAYSCKEEIVHNDKVKEWFDKN